MAKVNTGFEDMFEKYRLILNLKYLDRIFTSEAIHRDFYLKIKEARLKGIREDSFVRDYFKTHSQYIDREAYIFYTYKTLKEEIGEMRYPEIADNCKKALKNSRFVHYEPKKTKDGNDVEIVRISAKDLIGEREERKIEDRLDRWKNATKMITPVSFFSYASNTEIAQFCSSPALRSLIMKLNFINVVQDFYDLTPEEKLRFLEGDDSERLEELTRECASKLDIDSEEITAFYRAIPEYLERYPEEFDLDKIFLIAAFKASEFLEGASLSDEENEKYTILFKTSMEAIRKRGVKAEDLISFIDSLGKRDVSYKELAPMLKSITPSGHYVSSIERESILSQIFGDGGRLVALMNTDPEVLKILNLNENDFEELLTEEGILAFLTLTSLCPKSFINRKFKNTEIPEFDFEILVKANHFSKEQVIDYCKRMDTIGVELFEILNEKQLLDAQTTIGFFVDGKIEFELLERLSDEQKEELKDNLSSQELIDLYLKKDKSEEEEDKFNRYLRLFRNYKLRKLDKKERQVVDEQIIEALGDNLDDEIIKELYKAHLLTFQTLKEWTGTSIISDMMEHTEIRPEDVKEMCVDGDYDALFGVLSNPNIPKSRKMAIFRTSFANIEYESLSDEAKENLYLARDEALRLINLKDERVQGRGQQTGIKRGKGTGKRFNEYTSDPQLRWDLIDLMGDYSYEMLDQGMGIFKFPDYKGGTIVLEKMYKRDKPEYGRATKIIRMSVEDFEKIKNDLIQNDDIPPFLVDTHPALQGRITNITHTTAWGRQFAEYFEYDVGETRTPEEIDRIERKIQSILNSRELR